MVSKIGPSYEQLLALNNILQSDLQIANEALVAANKQVESLKIQLDKIQEVSARQLRIAADDVRRVNLTHKLVDAKANISLFFSMIGAIFAAAVGRFWR